MNETVSAMLPLMEVGALASCRCKHRVLGQGKHNPCCGPGCSSYWVHSAGDGLVLCVVWSVLNTGQCWH